MQTANGQNRAGHKPLTALRNSLLRRKLRKYAIELLRHARYLRQMRADIMPQEQLQQIRNDEEKLLRALSQKGPLQEVDSAANKLDQTIQKISAPGRFQWLRENLEVFVVAIAVAMGLRAYIIQPFKIPTGSMQPTLYGIHTAADSRKSWTDYPPLSWAKWLVTGENYLVVRAKESGILSAPRLLRHDPAFITMYIGRSPHRVPRNSRPEFMPGQYVRKGQIIWSGRTWSGDHVFVDKIRWNFTRPYRGQVIVFTTESIPTLPPGTHYIKRLIGMPGETVSINPPNVYINGKKISNAHQGIERISNMTDGYAGYLNADTDGALMRRPEDYIILRDNQFFALGDNTANSRDSRYWGGVPKQNMVGPAFAVYWPFSRRWGLIH